jgi:hypothetical protein
VGGGEAVAVISTVTAIRSGDCLKYAKGHLVVIVIAFIVGIASVNCLWVWGREIYQSSEMTPPRFTGLTIDTLPSGTKLMLVHFDVTRNPHCHLSGDNSLIKFTPPKKLDKLPLPSSQSRAGDTELVEEDLTLHFYLEKDFDPIGWRYQYQTWYECEPLGIIHWAPNLDTTALEPVGTP